MNVEENKGSSRREHENNTKEYTKNNFQVREYNASPKLALTSIHLLILLEKVKRKKIKPDTANIKLISTANKSVEYSNIKRGPIKSKSKNSKKVKVASKSPQKDNLS